MSGTMLTALRMLLRHGPQMLGLVVVGRAIVLSIAGNIRKGWFAPGVPLIAPSFSGQLVPTDGTAKRSPARKPS